MAYFFSGSPAELLVTNEQYKTLYDGVVHNQIAFYCAAAIIIWEYIIQLRAERQLVWTRSWSLAKWATLANRYTVLLLHLPICGASVLAYFTTEGCQRYYRIHPILCILTLIPAQVLLGIKTCAVYRYSKILIAAFAVLVASNIALAITLPLLAEPFPFPTGIPGCQAKLRNNMGAWPMFLPSVVTESFGLVLLLARYFRSKRSVVISDHSSQSDTNTIMTRIAADALVYFIPVAAFSIANIILFSRAELYSDRAVLAFPTVSVTSVLCTRMMLNFHQDVAANDLRTYGSIHRRIISVICGTFNPASPPASRYTTSATSSMEKTPYVPPPTIATDSSRTSMVTRIPPPSLLGAPSHVITFGPPTPRTATSSMSGEKEAEEDLEMEAATGHPYAAAHAPAESMVDIKAEKRL